MAVALGNRIPEIDPSGGGYQPIAPILLGPLRSEDVEGTPERPPQHLQRQELPPASILEPDLAGLYTGHLLFATFDIISQLAGYGIFTNPDDGFPPDQANKLVRLRIGITT